MPRCPPLDRPDRRHHVLNRGLARRTVFERSRASYGANFHPHRHAIVTEGVFTPDGRFHPGI